MRKLNIFRIKASIVSKCSGVFLRPFFGMAGRNLRVYCPLKIDGFKRIFIGENVSIGYKIWLAASSALNKDVEVVIGDGCTIGGFNHIYATGKIIIGKNVLTAERVYISDNLHNYEIPGVPIIQQGVRQLNEVEIGSGTWIGENACIMGVKIGRNCVIGANSVVTKDIPDFCIAVGVPARIIKRYNAETDKWEKVEK
ncbi:MAG: acyltransferase [Bacteroidales bacterium]|nr:acyltransferase [Bacteroidales bacterium]